jgi:hypothetical protein
LSTGWKKISPFKFQILNISKPAGPDNLPPKFLKAVFQSLVKPLTILFQKSLNFGVVPGDWKLANVSPIYKGEYNFFQYLNKTISNRYWSIISYIIATTFTFVNRGNIG